MTEWFSKKPGKFPSRETPYGVEMVVTDIPNWVTAPPELGGAVTRVIGHEYKVCPIDGCFNGCLVLKLEDELFVAECDTHNFVWYSTGR